MIWIVLILNVVSLLIPLLMVEIDSRRVRTREAKAEWTTMDLRLAERSGLNRR